jgi:hypothetical protein
VREREKEGERERVRERERGREREKEAERKGERKREKEVEKKTVYTFTNRSVCDLCSKIHEHQVTSTFEKSRDRKGSINK